MTEFGDAGTEVACICGPDKLYAEQAGADRQGAARRGRHLVWLAGSHETSGVDGTLHVGSDALAALHRTYDALQEAHA